MKNLKKDKSIYKKRKELIRITLMMKIIKKLKKMNNKLEFNFKIKYNKLLKIKVKYL